MIVTCDNCDDTSEAGWGDTPLCVDCQTKADPSKVCFTHQRTFEDAVCPLCADMDANDWRQWQGWNDSTMLDLAHQFIFDNGHGEQYADFVRGVAQTENEQP